MHFAHLVNARLAMSGGVYLMLTRRCPLSCAHCSTRSTPTSEQIQGDPYRQFVYSFSKEHHPSWMMLTGGEALLRPKLVADIARHARSVGTRVCLSTGLFFARYGHTPPAIRRAINEVDHVAASLDIYHEQEVAREQGYRVFEELLAAGKGLSFHLVGTGPDDPYLNEVIPEIRSRFDDQVAIVVSPLNPVGRAESWLEPMKPGMFPDLSQVPPEPCSVLTWPVVGFDGSVSPCCNQSVIDGPRPDHLQVGDIYVDDWPRVQHRHRTSVVLRAIKAFGPRYLAQALGAPELAARDYCTACKQLRRIPQLEQRVEAWLAEPRNSVIATLTDAWMADSQLVTLAGFEDLVYLGAPPELADFLPAPIVRESAPATT